MIRIKLQDLSPEVRRRVQDADWKSSRAEHKTNMPKETLSEPFDELLRRFSRNLFAKRVREYVFHGERKWRFDFAWLQERVAVELEGGVFKSGGKGHRSIRNFLRDCEKYNAAAELGWRVLRYTAKDLQERPLQCVEQIECAVLFR